MYSWKVKYKHTPGHKIKSCPAQVDFFRASRREISLSHWTSSKTKYCVPLITCFITDLKLMHECFDQSGVDPRSNHSQLKHYFLLQKNKKICFLRLCSPAKCNGKRQEELTLQWYHMSQKEKEKISEKINLSGYVTRKE